MRRADLVTFLVAPELLDGRAVVELPAGIVLRVGALPAPDAPTPASEADENYRLIPRG